MKRPAVLTRSGRSRSDSSGASPIVALLTRFPRLGEVKTRIAAQLGEEFARDLHDRLARAALARLLPLQACGEARVEVRTDAAFHGAAADWLAADLPRRARPAFRYQGEGGLGDKLAFAFSDGFNRRARAVVVVGADCPALETDDIREALRLLEGDADCVLGPATDGGYYLIGLRRSAAPRASALFGRMPWGGPDVLAQTRNAAENAGISVALLAERADCDVAADVPAAEAILAVERLSATAPVSVVIPTLDDATVVAAAISSAVAGGAAEVLVVDGASSDAGESIARAGGARYLSAPRGRASQMNAAAAQAHGDILCFLHADTVLPAGFADAVRDALARPGAVACAFDFAVPATSRHAGLIATLGQARWRMTHLPYGDQALCVPRPIFERLGGFSAMPTMEDYEMGLRLRRLGEIERVPLPAVTSARVWDEHGLVRPSLVNAAVIAGFRLGVSPERLAGWRRRISRG